MQESKSREVGKKNPDESVSMLIKSPPRSIYRDRNHEGPEKKKGNSKEKQEGEESGKNLWKQQKESVRRGESKKEGKPSWRPLSQKRRSNPARHRRRQRRTGLGRQPPRPGGEWDGSHLQCSRTSLFSKLRPL